VRTFRLIVAYDGTEFHGWQVQPSQRTVQGVIARGLESVLGSAPARLTGAGRTDAGVHARGQVVSFEAETTLPARAVGALLARRLPPDVRVCEATEVVSGFSARHSARARRYAYRLLRLDDLLWSRIAWKPDRWCDPDALSRAVLPLEGEQDFSAFQATGGAEVRTTCRMYRAGWSTWEGGVQFDVVADHFLYHMVRNIVGTTLRLAGAPDPAAAMRDVLASRDRRRAGITAPPQGLTLEQVFYDREIAA
jgi:tRNA pseudouridine38-40 synthase